MTPQKQRSFRLMLKASDIRKLYDGTVFLGRVEVSVRVEKESDWECVLDRLRSLVIYPDVGLGDEFEKVLLADNERLQKELEKAHTAIIELRSKL